MAGKEPGRDKYDLFIDWRKNNTTIRMPPQLKDPHLVPSFKTTAREFSRDHPSARFAVLTLWSAPHFWPLMVGPENHDPTSFRDLIGRNFIWKFVPKDMPCSEWSIHHTTLQRIEPLQAFFGARVVAKRDKCLVMGKDEGELFKFAAAAAFVIQRRPWRWEVDLWKSFLNVDVGFLEGLDDKWLD